MYKHVLGITLAIFCFLTFLPLTSHAKVIKTYDDTDGFPVVYSNIKLPNEPWEVVAFWKTLPTNPVYSLELSTYGYKEWIFFSGQLSMQIGDTWYDMASGKQTTKNDWPNVITTSLYTVPKPVIEKLFNSKESDHIRLRLEFHDKTYVSWNIPGAVLKEWREVINPNTK
jgi:hypothetical protein